MRPSATALNRAGRGSNSDRVTAAPGLNVTAQIGHTQGPNQLQALAGILGVGADIAMSDAQRLAQQRQREREEDEQLAAIADAEADAWGDTVDTDRIKTDRIYARRVSTLQGTRQGLELSEQLKTDFTSWRSENPLGTEEDARQWISDWTDRALVDDEGNPLAALDDVAQEALIRQSLGTTSFSLITQDRETFRANVRSTGASEAGGAFLSVIRQNGGVKTEDYQNLYTTLRGLGFSADEANAEIAQWANSAAETLDSPEPIMAVPDEWADGSFGPTTDPETLRILDSQRDLYAARQAKAEAEAMEPARLAWRLRMEDKASRGEDPTAEEMAEGLALGASDATVASFLGKARSTRDRLQREAETDARDALRHQETMNALQGTPHSVDKSKAEDAYTREFLAAPDGEARLAVVDTAIRNRGVLPGAYRNWINRIPNDPEKLGGWASSMSHVRNQDAQVYASINEDARTHFEALEALTASGRYTQEQAFQRLQVLDEGAGRDFVRSDVGQDLITELVGEDATPHDLRNAERIISTFGSFSDLPRSEAAALAHASYEATYFNDGGISYHRGFMANPDRVAWVRRYFSTELAKTGLRLDPDDLIVTPVGDGSQFTIRERGGVRALTQPFSADLLVRGWIEQNSDSIRSRFGTEAFGAARQFVDGDTSLAPERHIPGETGPERVQRMRNERQAVDALKRLNRSLTEE